MLLGDLMARFDKPSIVEETLLSLGDLKLLARMQEQATAEGESLGEFARNTAQRFAAMASDEDWVTLIGTLARAEDPGAAYLRHVFTRAVGH